MRRAARHDRDSAKDLVQDAILKVIDHYDEIRANEAVLVADAHDPDALIRSRPSLVRVDHQLHCASPFIVASLDLRLPDRRLEHLLHRLETRVVPPPRARQCDR